VSILSRVVTVLLGSPDRVRLSYWTDLIWLVIEINSVSRILNPFLALP
jgi:hypothetical protein